VTPAVAAAERSGVAFELRSYAHDPSADSYGLEAAEALGVPPQRVLKTLVVKTEKGTLAVGVVPVDRLLDLKALARALGAKRLEMAPAQEAERATGYVVGGISPLGQKKRLPMVVDDSALAFPTVLISAGRRGLDLELAPNNLLKLTQARAAAISR
jgi:Cys-tRNA(Pro)/Cys-tRNA(Cys) deacylase